MLRAEELVNYISDLTSSKIDPNERDRRIAWWTIQQTEMLKMTPSKIATGKKSLQDMETSLK